MNLGIFTGNLGRDAELGQSSKETVLNFSVGVNVGSKSEPETMWISCALWGKRADGLKPYLLKGTKVTVSGLVKLRTYQKKDGTTDTYLALTVQEVDLHGSSTGSSGNQAAPAAQKPAAAAPGGEFDEFADDIPF